jgi:hypothetical protein
LAAPDLEVERKYPGLGRVCSGEVMEEGLVVEFVADPVVVVGIEDGLMCA